MVIRVLLADDSRIMLDALRGFLSGYSEIALVGEAAVFLRRSEWSAI
jgi:DNA-binding NarL/FixJ family response regulator